MADCLIIAVAGKKGHERQAVAVAERLELSPRVTRLGDDAASGRGAPAVLPGDRLVIAAGRQSIAPARRIARQPRRPPVAVLQPVIWRPQDFDLIWAPLHDRGQIGLGRPRLLVETLTAPSAVTPDGMAVAAAAFAGTLGALPAPRIGVLIGGASRAHRFGPVEAAELGNRLAAFAAVHEASLLVTTSRRTSPETATVVAKCLATTRHALVDARSADASDAYAAILGLSDAFVVTGDSFAMMSEAAVTGRPLYNWRLPGGKAKFERFYERLAEHGAMRWFDGTLDRWTYPPLDAAATLAEALAPALALRATAADRI